MDSENVLEYFRVELGDLEEKLNIHITSEYREFCEDERQAYEKTPEYQKAKKKAYYSIPKSIRDGEALSDELAKLGYWVPGGGVSHKHIAYTERTNRLSEPVVPFVPSITIEEFRARFISSLENVVNHRLLRRVLENVRSNQFKLLECSDLKEYDADEEQIVNFCQQLIALYEAADIDVSRMYCSQPQSIVSNGCTIEALILEKKSATRVKVNVCKYSGQFSLLGKKKGETFRLPNVPFTYQITKIMK